MSSPQTIPALLVIDVQKGFDVISHWGTERNNPMAETNINILLHFFRSNKFPIFHIKHCSTEANSPLREGHPGNDFKEEAMPHENEVVIKKAVNSAFIGTDLKSRLDEEGIKSLVIVGITTDQCVSTTTRMAGNYGYKTYVIHDATATFDKTGINGVHYDAETIHQTTLASINQEFADVVSTADIISRFTA
ncbi:MAG: cysteine hydrolase [Chitinophaga sp.]|uniref:cysteine hydrolase family protein n=1 Tax=Chitinophaga sp. TaxID=1869181 RepID=UPI0025C5CD4B|nr:cysteine hydrolase family protein [Chitinophaga sp.]MBV8251045.1 cysteine hydrolase [Chitinophaga sp.]